MSSISTHNIFSDAVKPKLERFQHFEEYNDFNSIQPKKLNFQQAPQSVKWNNENPRDFIRPAKYNREERLI